MAGIDKTYIDWKDYPVYRQWWIDNYDKMVKEFGEPIWLYPFSAFELDDDHFYFEITPEYLKTHTEDIEMYKNSYDFPIWNTSETQDLWLLKNCPIQSFRDKMLEVYPPKWRGFKNQKWITKPNKKQKYIR